MGSHIILIGFMGTGKTTVGKMLARKLGFDQIDIDQRIVDITGQEIREYFSQNGEEGFRRLETKVLTKTLQELQPLVITTGGGIVLRPENRQLIREGGVSVALSAEAETIAARVKGDIARPLLQGNVQGNIRKLMAERAGMYDFADITIKTDHLSVEEIVNELTENPVFFRVKG